MNIQMLAQLDRPELQPPENTPKSQPRNVLHTRVSLHENSNKSPLHGANFRGRGWWVGLAGGTLAHAALKSLHAA